MTERLAPAECAGVSAQVTENSNKVPAKCKKITPRNTKQEQQPSMNEFVHVVSSFMSRAIAGTAESHCTLPGRDRSCLSSSKEHNLHNSKLEQEEYSTTLI